MVDRKSLVYRRGGACSSRCKRNNSKHTLFLFDLPLNSLRGAGGASPSPTTKFSEIVRLCIKFRFYRVQMSGRMISAPTSNNLNSPTNTILKQLQNYTSFFRTRFASEAKEIDNCMKLRKKL